MSARRPLIVLACAMLLAAAAGCPAGTPSAGPTKPPLPTVPSGDYFPLAEGARWTYALSTQGATVQGLAIYTITKLSKAGAETKAEGIRELRLTISGADRYDATAAFTWRKTARGVWETVEGEGGEKQILALPLRYDGGWRYGRQELEVSGIEELAVGGKTYKAAVRLRAYEGDKPGAAFFVKDVGMVSWSGRTLEAGCGRQIGFALQEHLKKDAPVPTPAPSAALPSCGPLPQPSNPVRTPTPTPIIDLTPTPSPAASAGATPSASPSASPSATASASATPPGGP